MTNADRRTLVLIPIDAPLACWQGLAILWAGEPMQKRGQLDLFESNWPVVIQTNRSGNPGHSDAIKVVSALTALGRNATILGSLQGRPGPHQDRTTIDDRSHRMTGRMLSRW